MASVQAHVCYNVRINGLYIDLIVKQIILVFSNRDYYCRCLLAHSTNNWSSIDLREYTSSSHRTSISPKSELQRFLRILTQRLHFDISSLFARQYSPLPSVYLPSSPYLHWNVATTLDLAFLPLCTIPFRVTYIVYSATAHGNSLDFHIWKSRSNYSVLLQ
jgi:hypothetical protein